MNCPALLPAFLALGIAGSVVTSLCRIAVAARQPDSAVARPNVVLIVTDDQGYGDLGCHGNPVLRTPHLDALYRQSIRLTNFHVDPTCSPTRAALMTGRYSTRAGVWHTVMGRHLPRAREVLMPRVFAENGYRTAIFGKWHLGDAYPFRPQDRGFAHVLVHGGGGVGQIPDFWANDYFDDTYFHNGRPQPFRGYCTDVFFDEAIRFITASRDQPFFVYLTTNAPHSPYRVADTYSRAYEDQVGGDADLAKFYGMIANIDENVGRLLEKLDQLELSSNTLVIFMTDNGTARGATFSDYRGNEGRLLSGYNAGMRGRKGSPYEGGHRVPCFIRWPAADLAGGRDIGHLSAHFDLLPTLVELCQLNPSAGPPPDGISLAPLLHRWPGDWPERTVFVHHQELPRPQQYRFGCVLRGTWSLILRNDQLPSPRFELYDLASDPAQTVDLSADHADVVGRLRAAYDQWWAGLAPGFDEFAEIVVGAEQQDSTRLTCFDWHSSQRWWQNNVRSATVENGFWALRVARGGTYEITLRRWPEEADLPITAAPAGGKAIEAVEAGIRIGDLESKQPIDERATAVRFQVALNAGSIRLETWFTDNAGQTRGAYYATIRRVAP